MKTIYTQLLLKKKNLFSLCFLMFFFMLLNSRAQVYQWGKKMGGTSYEEGNSIKTDAAGNVYTTGSFLGTVDFDPGPGTATLTSAGGADIFISKLDASGNFVWAKAMGGTGSDVSNSIALDAQGNVYTTGIFS